MLDWFKLPGKSVFSAHKRAKKLALKWLNDRVNEEPQKDTRDWLAGEEYEGEDEIVGAVFQEKQSEELAGQLEVWQSLV